MAGLPRFHGRIQHRRRGGEFLPTTAMDRPPEPAQRNFTRVGPAAQRRGQVSDPVAMGLEPGYE